MVESGKMEILSCFHTLPFKRGLMLLFFLEKKLYSEGQKKKVLKRDILSLFFISRQERIKSHQKTQTSRSSFSFFLVHLIFIFLNKFIMRNICRNIYFFLAFSSSQNNFHDFPKFHFFPQK